MKTMKVLVFMMGITFLSSCTTKTDVKTVSPVGIKVMSVSSFNNELCSTYVGTVEENYGSLLSFATMGTVNQVYVDQGTAVHKGQILAILDKSTMQNAYDIAKSTLIQTRDAYHRMELLYKKGSLPEIKFIEIQTQLSQSEAAERIARKNLKDCILRAPFDGYISQRSVDMGNNVAPGFDCFKLVKIDNVKVKVSIPEKEIAGIHTGQMVSFTVAALNNRRFVATVKEKGVQANPLSHTYDIKLELPNADHALLPGMVCSVSIRQKDITNAIIIPQDAILVDGQGTYVWIADGNVTHRRSIVVGEANNQGIVIIDGLHEGEQIVVSGQNKVSEDSKIKKQ